MRAREHNAFCFAAASACWVLACHPVAEPPPPLDALRVEVFTAQGRPVPEATVQLAPDRGPAAPHNIAGTTDASGALLIRPAPPQTLVSVRCPAGYLPPSPARRPVPTNASAPAESPLTLKFECNPSEIQVAVVVRTPAARDVPVSLDGRALGTTGADGVLHSLLRLPAARSIEVTLGPPAGSSVGPLQRRRFQLPHQDTVVALEARYPAAAPPSKPRTRAAPPKPSAPHLERPYRLD